MNRFKSSMDVTTHCFLKTFHFASAIQAINCAIISNFVLSIVIVVVLGTSAYSNNCFAAEQSNSVFTGAIALQFNSLALNNSDSDNFRITQAQWQSKKHKLEVKGKGAPINTSIDIVDAVSGTALGSADVRRSGEWKFVKDININPPCRIKAIAGDLVKEKDIKNPPDNCDNGGGEPPPAPISHQGFYETYEGSKTCNVCHDNAVEVHASVHYQWSGSTPHVINMDAGGKLGGINDFCGYPDINFIGLLTNLDGETVSGGCAICHVGMGAKPAATATPTQLENIDCLICHSDSYRRKVEQLADGNYHFVPAPERMDVPLLQAITDIQAEPTKGACVNCHAYAGGGCNNKRGDMEDAHRNPPNASFDVHMASNANGGAGLNCQNCHITKNHRFAGRGVDLRPTDLDLQVRCTNCHTSQPHDNNRINRHTNRVDCSVCHIPRFAKIVSTDMIRDFSKPPEILETNRLYEPAMERASNVIPVYRFWNGQSKFYQFGMPFELNNNGRVLMAGPVGDITDPLAKIFPFKQHLAVLPYEVDTKRILPLKMGILFQTGNVDGAIKQGALEAGWPLANGYDFVEVERFMGIFHEVSPKNEALKCNDCHDNVQRMDFAALGYTPLPARNPKTASNCASGCHGDESDEWQAQQFFTQVHNKHVNDENFDCKVCHNYY